MTTLSPIVNAPNLYVDGLGIARASNTTLTLAAGSARDSANVNDITLSSAATINGAVVGANGCDAAVLAASSMYAVYVIGDSRGIEATAGLLSLSTNSSPTLPFGYDMYRRVGWILTNGSSQILQFWQTGNGLVRTIWYDVGISELSAGSSTTYANIDLTTSVPPLATNVWFDIAYTANSATNTAQFLPFGSSATNGVVRFGCGVAAAQVGQIKVPCRLNSAAPTVQYKVASSDALTLLTTGFEDILS